MMTIALLLLAALNLIFTFLILRRSKIRSFSKYNPKLLFSNVPQNLKTGSLSVYTGPMFCGKTTHLINEITRHIDLDSSLKALLINHMFDTRDSEKVISSHSSAYKGISSKISCTASGKLSDVDVSEYSVIGIDEAQFFPDLLSTVSEWLKLGKHIFVAGLDSDANMEIFGEIHMLLHMADSFTKLQAICTTCLSESKSTITPISLNFAPFTCKHGGGSSQIEVGGASIYAPTCRYHHSKHSK